MGDDNETIRFIQRIRNDQKSMMRNIADNYIRNYRNGLRVSLTKDSYDQIQLDVDNQNNTTVVEVISENIINQIIANGLELKRVKQAKDLTGISMYDCRFYLSKIVNDKHIGDISNFIKAILFMFLYIDKYNKEDINSSRFLTWSAELFRKTNSNNPNIKIIKDTLINGVKKQEFILNLKEKLHVSIIRKLFIGILFYLFNIIINNKDMEYYLFHIFFSFSD